MYSARNESVGILSQPKIIGIPQNKHTTLMYIKISLRNTKKYVTIRSSHQRHKKGRIKCIKSKYLKSLKNRISNISILKIEIKN